MKLFRRMLWHLFVVYFVCAIFRHFTLYFLSCMLQCRRNCQTSSEMGGHWVCTSCVRCISTYFTTVSFWDMPVEISSYPINSMDSQWVKAFYNTTVNPLKIKEKQTQPDSSSPAWQALEFAQLPCYCNYTLHTKLPHKSLFPESSQQGETPGCDYLNEDRREEGNLIAMETCSLALGAGRHWKQWTQGTGCDIMQAFRAASCSGTSGQRVAEKGRVKWVGLPSNQLLRLWLWLHEWNDRKPPPTTQSKKHN